MMIEGKKISTCIVAKAKYALLLTGRKPSNTESCSREYWIKVVTCIGQQRNYQSEDIQKAIDRAELYDRTRMNTQYDSINNRDA